MNKANGDTINDSDVELVTPGQSDVTADLQNPQLARNVSENEKTDLVSEAIDDANSVATSALQQQEEDESEKEGVDENCYRLLRSLNIHQIDLESE